MYMWLTVPHVFTKNWTRRFLATLLARTKLGPTQMSINNRVKKNSGRVTAVRTINCTQKHSQILKTQCWIKEVRHIQVLMVWFYLCTKSAKLNSSVESQDSGSPELTVTREGHKKACGGLAVSASWSGTGCTKLHT